MSAGLLTPGLLKKAWDRAPEYADPRYGLPKAMRTSVLSILDDRTFLVSVHDPDSLTMMRKEEEDDDEAYVSRCLHSGLNWYHCDRDFALEFVLDPDAQWMIESETPSEAAVSEPATLPKALCLPANLARLPSFVPGSSRISGNDDWCPVGHLYGHSVELLEPRGPLRLKPDALLLMHLSERYMESPDPDNRKVPFSLGEAALACGYASKGGQQRRKIKDSLMRLRATTFRTALRFGDPAMTEKAEIWGLLDRAETTTSLAGGHGTVTLSETYARMLRDNLITYLDAEALRTLIEWDEYAARFWSWLESETFKRGRRWQYLLYPTDAPTSAREVPYIVDLLRVHRSRRREEVAFIERLCERVCEVDAAYSLSVERARGGGHKLVVVKDVTRVHEDAGTRYAKTREVGTARRAAGYSETRGNRENACKTDESYKLPSALPSFNRQRANVEERYMVSGKSRSPASQSSLLTTSGLDTSSSDSSLRQADSPASFNPRDNTTGALQADIYEQIKTLTQHLSADSEPDEWPFDDGRGYGR